MRLGINTMVWGGGYDGRQLGLFEPIRALGYEVVELAVFDFDAVDPAPVRRALAETGLTLTVSTALPDGLSIASPEPEVRRHARQWIVAAVRKTAAMGGVLLAGPLYTPVGAIPGRRTAAEWDRAVDEYRVLSGDIESAGARLALEPLNRFETCFLNTAADARRLCEQIGAEAIGVLFDTFHANIEEQDTAAAARSLGPWLIHVHLSDNDRGVPGDGHVPFRAVAAELAAMGYQGCAVVESFAGSIPELARATAMWRDFAASPEEFARRAICYLQPVFEAV